MSNTPDSNRPDSSWADRSHHEPDGDAKHTDLPIGVEIVIDESARVPISSQVIRASVNAAARDQGFQRGNVGVRITDDPTIHRINRDHLGHDYPTDVISFDYDSTKPMLDGEMIISVDTAADRARELGWALEHELVLYLVHGTLHITGLDDLSDADRQRMRSAERRVMTKLGIESISRFGPDAISSSTVAHPCTSHDRLAENQSRRNPEATIPRAEQPSGESS